MATTSTVRHVKAGVVRTTREPDATRAPVRALRAGSGASSQLRALSIITVVILAVTIMGLAPSMPVDAVTVLTTPPKIFTSSCFIEATEESTPNVPDCTPSTAVNAAGAAITPTETIPSTPSIGLHKVTVRAEDGSGNWASTTRVILVEDTKAPIMPDLSSCVIEATGRLTPTAACAIPPGIVCDIPEHLPAGPRESYTCTATDRHGNFATKEIYVTVEDRTPPTCTSSRIPMYIEARGQFTEIVITDNNINPLDREDPAPALSHSHKPIAVDDWGIIRWTVTDDADLTATCTQSIIVRDTTPPSFLSSLDPILVTSAVPVSVSSVALTPPEVTDIADPDPAVYHRKTGMFAVGENEVTWFARDASINTSSATQKVIVSPPAAP